MDNYGVTGVLEKVFTGFYEKLNIFKLLKSTNIRNRLIISFLIISLLPISFIGIFSFLSTYRDMENKLKDYSSKMTIQIADNINYRFKNFVDKFERIAFNNLILADLYNFEKQNEENRIRMNDSIRITLASIVGPGEGIDTIEICSISGARYYYSQPISKGSASKSKLISDTYKTEDIIWKVTNKELEHEKGIYIILAKKMRIQFDKEVLGFELMSIRRDYLDELCKHNTHEKKQYVIITDREGMIISHPDKDKVMKKIDDAIFNKIKSLESLRKQGKNPEKIFKIAAENETVMVSYDTLTVNDWLVVNVMPYSYLMESTVHKGVITLGTAMMCIIVSLIISLMVTESISSPVRRLIYTMQKVGRGDLDAKIEGDLKDTNDEHALLAAGFNDMTSKLKKLIDDVYRSQLKEKELEFLKKEAELNALQQQINPHFLYNTLEAIYWTAQLKGDDEISEMVTALGNFFRTSINKGLEYITIEDEIKNVQNYVYLQKIRFNDRFWVKWEIDDEIIKYKTIKLILQPIIENAIIHGIENMERGGLIIIKAFKYEDNIIFEVEDNGVGMSDEEVEKLERYVDSQEKDTRGSIGVKNVNQRIKLYFGEKYGIKINSELNKGTKVSLTIPAFLNEVEISFHS